MMMNRAHARCDDNGAICREANGYTSACKQHAHGLHKGPAPAPAMGEPSFDACRDRAGLRASVPASARASKSNSEWHCTTLSSIDIDIDIKPPGLFVGLALEELLWGF